ncbi:MAG TPA: AIM24 family protein [Streptosporangiaceae bacterium]
MSTPTATYTCPYCRMVNNDDGAATCPRCGAPVDVRLRVSKSGWAEQPAIRDMARIKFNRSTCQISGNYVPVAEMNLHDEDWIYFSHHVLLHTEPRVRLEAMKMAGGWNRILAGMPLIMMKAQGPGHMALSADHPGEILAVPLEHNQGIDVAEHRFLAATGNVGYQWNATGVWFTTWDDDNNEEWHYPMGQFIDRFQAQGGPGLLLLHAPGNSFVRDLGHGEHIMVQPTGLIWKDASVRTSLHFEYPRGQYWFSSARWESKSIWLTLTGPGRVAIQSIFERPELVGSVVNNSPATTHFW